MGSKGAKSVSRSQFPLVTSTFSLLISPWHTPFAWHCAAARSSRYTSHRFSVSVRKGRVETVAQDPEQVLSKEIGRRPRASVLAGTNLDRECTRGRRTAAARTRRMGGCTWLPARILQRLHVVNTRAINRLAKSTTKRISFFVSYAND